MLPPIRPSPTMPIFMAPPSLPSLRSAQRLVDGGGERREPHADVGAEMHPQRAATAPCQDLEIAARLRRLDQSKRISPPGDRDVARVVAGDLEEDAGRG